MDTATGADRTFVDAGNSPAELTAVAYLRELRAGRMSAHEYICACLDRIERFDPTLRAWKAFDREAAEKRAQAIDDAIARSEPVKLLSGAPLGVKDIFNTYDFPTSMGSPILEAYTPGNDARVVSNLRLEGGIVVGKTVTAEFAVHHPGPTRNPFDLQRTPGTSSSGSAVAVATRMCPVALATQTAGSIIRPASYCGIWGFKPSFGLIPRTAMLKTTDTLDTVGFMARSIDDISLVFEICRVRGHNYPVSEAALNDPSRGEVFGRPYRIGIVRGTKSEFASAAAADGLRRIADRLTAVGHEVFEYKQPASFEEIHDLHERIYRRSLAYYFQQEWRAAAEKFSPVMRRMVEGGLEISTDSYLEAIARQRAISQEFDAEHGKFDVLLDLSTADEAPLGLDAPDLPDHCLMWTFVGAPAITAPLLRGSSGLPVGAQFVARRFDDYKLLAFVRVVQAALLD